MKKFSLFSVLLLFVLCTGLHAQFNAAVMTGTNTQIVSGSKTFNGVLASTGTTNISGTGALNGTFYLGVSTLTGGTISNAQFITTYGISADGGAFTSDGSGNIFGNSFSATVGLKTPQMMNANSSNIYDMGSGYGGGDEFGNADDGWFVTLNGWHIGGNYILALTSTTVTVNGNLTTTGTESATSGSFGAVTINGTSAATAATVAAAITTATNSLATSGSTFKSGTSALSGYATTSGSAAQSGFTFANPIVLAAQNHPGALRAWYSVPLGLVTATNGQTINSVQDLSGNGWTLTGTMTYNSGGVNGNPALYSGTGASQYMVSGSGIVTGTAKDYTIFEVFQAATIPSQYSADLLLIGNYSTTTIAKFQLYNTANSGVNFATSDFYAQCYYGGTQNLTGKGRVTNAFAPMVVCYEVSNTYGYCALWINGECIYWNSSATAIPAPSSCYLYIGNSGQPYSETWSGYTSELAFYQSWLSTSEKKGIMSDLLRRYLKPLPTGMTLGDSIGESGYNQPTMVGLIQKYFPEMEWRNTNRGGTYFSSISTGAHPWDEVLNTVTPGEPVIIWPPSIDNGNGTSAATNEANVRSVSQSIITAGGIPILLTQVPRYNSSVTGTQTATDAQRLLYNASVVSGTMLGTGTAYTYADVTKFPPMQSATAWQIANSPWYQLSGSGTDLMGPTNTGIVPYIVQAIHQATGQGPAISIVTGTLVSGTATVSDPNIFQNNVQAIDTTITGSGAMLAVSISGTTATITGSSGDTYQAWWAGNTNPITSSSLTALQAYNAITSTFYLPMNTFSASTVTGSGGTTASSWQVATGTYGGGYTSTGYCYMPTGIGATNGGTGQVGRGFAWPRNITLNISLVANANFPTVSSSSVYRCFIGNQTSSPYNPTSSAAGIEFSFPGSNVANVQAFVCTSGTTRTYSSNLFQLTGNANYPYYYPMALQFAAGTYSVLYSGTSYPTGLTAPSSASTSNDMYVIQGVSNDANFTGNVNIYPVNLIIQ